MISGLVAYVELEHEIAKWTSSIAISLASRQNHQKFKPQMEQVGGMTSLNVNIGS